MSLNQEQKKIIEQKVTEVVSQHYRKECFFSFQKSYLDTQIFEYKKMCTDYNNQVNNLIEEIRDDFNSLTDNCIINHTDISGLNHKKDLMDVIELAIDKKTMLMSLNSKCHEIINQTNQIHSQIEFYSKDQLKKEVQLIANDYNLTYQFAASDEKKVIKNLGIFGLLISILVLLASKFFDSTTIIASILCFMTSIILLVKSSVPVNKFKLKLNSVNALEKKKSEIIRFAVQTRVYINAYKDIAGNMPIVDDFKNWLNHHQQIADTALADAAIDEYLYFISPKLRNSIYLQYAKEALLGGYENIKELNEYLEDKYYREQQLEIEKERRIDERIYHNEMLELVKEGQKRDREIQKALLEEARSQRIAAQSAASAAQETARATKEYGKKSLANQKKVTENTKKTSDYVERDYYDK